MECETDLSFTAFSVDSVRAVATAMKKASEVEEKAKLETIVPGNEEGRLQLRQQCVLKW